MLALNSYGLPGRGNNQSAYGQLPRLPGTGIPRGTTALPPLRLGLSPTPPAQPRGSLSLSKLELLRVREAEAEPQHPLYRTTTGYDYGRIRDFQDVALSVPKHARMAGFTKEFVAGPFQDNCLTSIDKSKLRAESWERKVQERTKQMKIKYDALQQRLEVKRETRRRERDVRRRELELRQHAAVVLQAHARGFLVRRRLARARYELQMIAAHKIQHTLRARVTIRRAQDELEALRRQRLDGYATRVQRVGRHFLLRRDAQRQLSERRRQRQLSTSRRQYERELGAGSPAEHEAAAVIQRAIRAHHTRQVERTASYRSTTSSSTNSSGGGDGRDLEREYGGSGGGLNSSRGGRNPQHQQRLSRNKIVGLKQRKREKSSHRLNL